MKMFKKLKPIKGRHQGCLHAGVAEEVLPMDSFLAVGFGSVEVSRDGEVVWSGDDTERMISEFEERAVVEDGDWRVRFGTPLSSKTYQRQGAKNWVLVEQGRGFA